MEDGNNVGQLEHYLVPARRIDHFLKKYCSVETSQLLKINEHIHLFALSDLDDLTKTKVTLLYELKVHEEQLYEMFMYLRNKFNDEIKENIPGDWLLWSKR